MTANEIIRLRERIDVIRVNMIDPNPVMEELMRQLELVLMEYADIRYGPVDLQKLAEREELEKNS